LHGFNSKKSIDQQPVQGESEQQQQQQTQLQGRKLQPALHGLLLTRFMIYDHSRKLLSVVFGKLS
jgi:hypothetical protein